MSRRFLILANPISGGGKSRRVAPDLRDALVARGHEVELHFTTHKGDAGQQAARCGEGRFDAVVSVGGDGTLNEILNGLRDLSQPLAILPLGTANVLAKELRLPFAPQGLAELLHGGRARELAVGTANGRRFLLFCGVGFDARMVEELERVRTGTGGMRRWIGPVWNVIRSWPRQDLHVVADGSTVATTANQVLVTRVRGYGGILHLPRAVDWSDGKLHLLCFLQRTRLAWAAAAARAMLGRLEPSPRLLHGTATRITVTAATPTPYQVDGDLGGTTPVEIELLPGRARVFTPL